MSAAATTRGEGRHEEAQDASTTVPTSPTTASGDSGSGGEEATTAATTGQRGTAAAHDGEQQHDASAPTPVWGREGVDELVKSMWTTTLKPVGRRWMHTPSNDTQLTAYQKLERALVSSEKVAMRETAEAPSELHLDGELRTMTATEKAAMTAYLRKKLVLNAPPRCRGPRASSCCLITNRNWKRRSSLRSRQASTWGR